MVKENYLEQVDVHLDRFFEVAKLKLAAEMAARSNILSKTYDTQYLDHILLQLEAREGTELETNLYGKARNLYIKDEREEFNTTLETFLVNIGNLHHNDKNLLFHHLLNFTIRKGNAGHHAYMKDSFKLYQIGLSERFLLQNSRMTDTTFTNICALGIKLENYEWVEEFIESYYENLNHDVRDNAKTLSLAFLHYGKGEFERTEELITTFQFTNPFYQVRGKILATRALYELFIKDESYYELIVSNLLAFGKYLRRNNTLGSNNKEVYIRFIQHLKTTINLKVKRQLTKQRKESLKEKLNKEKQVINRSWLMQKIDEL